MRTPVLQLQTKKVLRTEKTPVGSPRKTEKSACGVFTRGIDMILLASTSSNVTKKNL
ncbi:hypothetical protein ES319_D13G149100v1 [Gossypium barbadense]|uniref:Uncharacterized protein n=2 Tax=Gossypium TaxID=3633 RepID=A0A5J5NMA9_GOSBA|nr:hypothetical protein ES319_D13G149100v1 [Gossypium barbadense]TYG37663.1 hypothetical protein ES288_D13G159700v1 [Gossypium darwinii]